MSQTSSGSNQGSGNFTDRFVREFLFVIIDGEFLPVDHGIVLHLATNQLQKTSTAKYVDELHIHPEKGFMIVKGNSHVIGERLKLKVNLIRGWHEICKAV
jgi:hypothetical protein